MYMRRRRSKSRSSGALSRRQVLLGLAGTGLVGAGATSLWTGAFSNMTAARTATVTVVADENAYLGLEVYSPVSSNSQDPLVDVTNNLQETATITVSLGNCRDGTLYGPSVSGCPISFDLPAGNAKLVEIAAAVKNTTIPFTVEAETDTDAVTATRDTYAESGNAKGAVEIKKIQNFRARYNDWTIKQVKVHSDNPLAHVEYEVRDESGSVVGMLDHYPSGTKYHRDNIVVQPDSGYQIQKGETYTLKLTAYDEQGNYDTETRSDTA
jgi:hypothetical protein